MCDAAKLQHQMIPHENSMSRIFHIDKCFSILLWINKVENNKMRHPLRIHNNCHTKSCYTLVLPSSFISDIFQQRSSHIIHPYDSRTKFRKIVVKVHHLRVCSHVWLIFLYFWRKKYSKERVDYSNYRVPIRSYGNPLNSHSHST